MPYVFSYRDNSNENIEFSCVLKTGRCRAVKTDERRCKKNCIIGLPYCWIHLASIKQLKIKTSTLPNAGKGLFAITSNSDLKEQQTNHLEENVELTEEEKRNGIVFKRNTMICAYDGELVSDAVVNRRYGRGNFAPYLAKVRGRNMFEDGACERGTGAMPNHLPRDHPDRNASLVTDENSDPRRIYVIAAVDIRDGEEIFVDYGRFANFDDSDDIVYDTKSTSKTSRKYREAQRSQREERQFVRNQENRAQQRSQRRLSQANQHLRRSSRRR